MAFDYLKAFGLLDNPFGPFKPIPGLTIGARGSDLQRKPLMLNAEPCLRKLFSEQMSPFKVHLEQFQKFARRLGYLDSPPSAGNNSALFSIYGHEGTGKTTLAQAMVSWLRTCKPTSGNWVVHDGWSDEKLKDSAQQIARAAAEHALLKKESTTNSYCCVVADNLLPGALDRVLDMYNDLTRDRFVFLFLLSGDRELFPRLSDKSQLSILPFRMRPLTAEPALEFVCHRIRQFRAPKEARPQWMDDASLFPFDKKDIQTAFDGGSIYNHLPGEAIALRDFSVMIHEMLQQRLEELDDAFDIRSITENDSKHHMIRLSDEYRKMVA